MIQRKIVTIKNCTMHQELMQVYEKHFKKEWNLTGYRGPVIEDENMAYAELWLAKEIKKKG